MLAMLIMLLKSFDVSFFLVDMLELFVCVECKDWNFSWLICYSSVVAESAIVTPSFTFC